jgi:hypothetical protein
MVDNVELRCRAHNQYEGHEAFGGGMLTRRQLPTTEDDANLVISTGVGVHSTRSATIGSMAAARRAGR